jgi:glutathione peroxidase
MTFRVVVMVAVVCVVVLAVRLRQTYAADIVKEPTTMPTVAASAGQPASPLDFTVKDIDEKDVSLSDYKGKVVLIVNVASKCGFTPQYTALEATYRKYKDQGFVILGFPANNFMSQEPGTDAEIQQFCKRTYDVTFPMFSKISVKGDDQAPLYKFLTDKAANPATGGDIKWNFTKFLVGRDGKIVARFESPVKPESPEVVSAIEGALKK